MDEMTLQSNELVDEIKKLKQELVKTDNMRIPNEIYWVDIIGSGEPRKALQKWRENNEKKAIKRHDIEERIKIAVERFRRVKLAEIRNIEYKYDCSICLIIRDENEYLEEWLNWHIGQGVEHFYIYDHGSKLPVAEFISSLRKGVGDRTTVIDHGGSHKNAQLEAYNGCLARFGTESKWIGFVDADEMVRVKSGTPLPEFLEDYEDYAGVMAVWILYGAGGQEKKSALPCRERFTVVSPGDFQSGIGKVFVRPPLMKKMVIHNGYPLDGFEVVDEFKHPIKEAETRTEAKSTELICIDHYFTKSYEEWLEKMRRGSCDPLYNRHYQEFFLYNPDMEHCKEKTYPLQRYEVSKKTTGAAIIKNKKRRGKKNNEKMV
jgi:hypothetical protein